MKYIIAIALMFAIATPVLASESQFSISEEPSVSESSAVTPSTSVSNGHAHKSSVDTDEPEAPKGRKSSSGSQALTIQDRIFNLIGVRFDSTNDPRMIEIYNTLYQILVMLKTV